MSMFFSSFKLMLVLYISEFHFFFRISEMAQVLFPPTTHRIFYFNVGIYRNTDCELVFLSSH